MGLLSVKRENSYDLSSKFELEWNCHPRFTNYTDLFPYPLKEFLRRSLLVTFVHKVCYKCDYLYNCQKHKIARSYAVRFFHWRTSLIIVFSVFFTCKLRKENKYVKYFVMVGNVDISMSNSGNRACSQLLTSPEQVVIILQQG